MPFGLAGAPSSFQHLIDKIFLDLPFITCHLDGVLVHSDDMRLYEEHLKEVFHRLREAGLILRVQKCHTSLSEVQYLGHTFSAKGTSPDNKKVQAVQEWPVPADMTALRSFLGLVSYYWRYIPPYADVAAPLYHLTPEGVPFVWGAKCEQALQRLKDLLTTAPILAYPQFQDGVSAFILHTDASDGGLGAVLEQDG